MASPDRERSVKQMIGRVADPITGWGAQGGYFATDDERETFHAELKAILVNQYASFNSPVWFNVGFEETPQCSACFILSIDDTRWSRSSTGSGARGSSLRRRLRLGPQPLRLRPSKEQLLEGRLTRVRARLVHAGRRRAAPPSSRAAERRAAKMVVLDVDHPDVDEFIWCKAKEERKARVLEQAGYDMSLDSTDWASIQYQNANNWSAVTDAFMEAVTEGKEWALTARTDGTVVETVEARQLLRDMAAAAWECADPGVQYDTTINAWHTSPITAGSTRRTRAPSTCTSTTRPATSRRST